MTVSVSSTSGSDPVGGDDRIAIRDLSERAWKVSIVYFNYDNIPSFSHPRNRIIDCYQKHLNNWSLHATNCSPS